MTWYVNSGGSSIKLKIENEGTSTSIGIELRCIGLAEQELLIRDGSSIRVTRCNAKEPMKAVEYLCSAAVKELGERNWPEPSVVAHRVKFAGFLAEAVEFDQRVSEKIADDAYLNVQHAALCLLGRRILGDYFPNSKHFAIFDSGVFSKMAAAELPFPDSFARRYELLGMGHQGLANASVLRLLYENGIAGKRTIVVHIGSGASVSAFKDDLPVYNSMMYSAYDGPIMNNRSGNIPVGVFLRLLNNGCPKTHLPEILGEFSGIYGLVKQSPSGKKKVQEILRSIEGAAAKRYFDHFAEHILAAIIQCGLPEIIVFSGGVVSAVPELIEKILVKVTGIQFGKIQYVDQQCESASLTDLNHDGKFSLYIAKIDEFEEMKFRLKNNLPARTSLLHCRCLCPGIATGRLYDYHKHELAPQDSIVFAAKITPELVLKSRNCAAIIVEEGDPTYHGAAISRELGLPCVSQVSISTLRDLGNGCSVLVDAASEEIYVQS